MSKTGDIIEQHAANLDSVARTLTGLGQAFARTGNGLVADELRVLAEAVATAADEIHKAYRDEQAVYVEQSLANSGRFHSTILRGLIDGKDPKDAALEGVKHHLDRDLIDARG